ncbi:MAG: nitroreductase [Clostridia bacterium]|nr:nitroreductase [Clostridia bacterium]
MTLQEAMEQRHAVRKYLDKPIEPEKAEELKKQMDALNAQYGIHMQLVLDEPKAFTNRRASYGHFENAKNYIAMVASKDKEEEIGYAGEQVVLRAQQLGLNTVWVAMSFDKVDGFYKVESWEKVLLVVAIGYGENQGKPHKSKELEKVVKVEGDMPEWFRKGAEAALLAPTAINQQKFKFILNEDGTVTAKAGLGPHSKADLGIAKYHFELGAGTETVRWK